MEIQRVVIYSLTVLIIIFTGYGISGYYIDSSQTAYESQKSGAPSTDKVWTLQEYEMFYRYLSVLPKEVDYPILSSEKSGNLFRNLIDSLDDVLYEPLTDEMIFMQIIKFKIICQNILMSYVEKDIEVQKYNNEVAYLYGIQIQILSQMQKIGERISKAGQKESENDQIQKKGLEFMKQGATAQVGITLDLLGESGAFKDNETLLLYFKQYVPELLQFFDINRKDMIKQRIIEVSKSSDMSSTKKLLDDMASGL